MLSENDLPMLNTWLELDGGRKLVAFVNKRLVLCLRITSLMLENWRLR